MTILDKIVAAKRRETDALRECGYYRALDAMDAPQDVPSMAAALRKSAKGIIAEFKRRSPSKGLINGNADVEQTVGGYAGAGAAACSVLTDTAFFGGSCADLVRARVAARECSLPLLRKEFVVVPEQLAEARVLGASAVLLIASVLDGAELASLCSCASSLGLETLVEVHTLSELDKTAGCGADMVGVNSRDLADMSTDVERAMHLGEEVARRAGDAVVIAESGITSMADVERLRGCGYRGFLIGERFMHEDDPAEALRAFLNNDKKMES
ncbi:indole-3-glycerol-phosphate synthase [uncultured Muribaculum sp.]|uniref:indole-3-glycerol phosphate synthase TrpC n=1 Tax=uncultured Muribaculum sp. TaxID=1918613 RepID=UPI00260059B0|nr:indole-3-glycerol phosphate synthase TrpC [uncultured Muribaculum sp.]